MGHSGFQHSVLTFYFFMHSYWILAFETVQW